MSRAWPSESMTLIASRISIGTSANLLLGPQLVENAALFHLLHVAHVHEFLRLYLLRPRVNLSDLIQDRLQRLVLEDEPGLQGLALRIVGRIENSPIGESEILAQHLVNKLFVRVQDFCRLRHRAHELSDNLRPLCYHRALGHKGSGNVWDAQIRAVHDIMVALCNGLGVRRSGHSGHLDIFAQQSREAFRITAALDKAKIPARLHAEAPERLNGKIVGVAADAAYGDLLALEIFGLLQVSSRHDALGHDVFYAAYEDEVRGALNVGANVSYSAGQGHFRVTAQHGGSDHAGRGDINQLKVEIVLLEEPGLMGDPRHRLRHHPGGVDAEQLVRRPCHLRRKRR